MSTMTAPAAPSFSDDDIASWLGKNPDFFQNHPQLLESMNLPGQSHGRGVVDFQTVLLERLKNDKSKAHHLQRELIETFRANMNNQTRIQTAVLVLLEAESFEELIQTMTQDFPILLDVDTAMLVIEATSKEVPFIHQAGMRFVRAGTVNKLLGSGDALLQANINGQEDIFGPGAGLVKSQALMRLEISPETPAGLLAFGSRNPDAFQPDQAIDQIGFLAQVVERVLRLWLEARA